jgi:ERCC4-type nuclease
MGKLLDIFSKKKVKSVEKSKIVVDNRERNSLVVSELMKKGYEIEWKQLAVGDYFVNGVAIERKTVSDFKSSIVNKRIIQQLLELKQYPKSFLIVEGIIEDDVYSSNGLHENAFRGFLLSVVLEFGVGVIYTYDAKDTAKYIDVLARRREKGEIGIRASKIALSREEQQQFILEGFPNVGVVKAKKLLGKFGSLGKIFGASVEELEEVLGVRAKEFKELLD